MKIICLYFCLFSFSANAQTKNIAVPDGVSKYFTNGFIPLDVAYGDINNDKYDDIIVILHDPSEDTIHSQNVRRPLLLLLNGRDQTYKLAARNDNVVHCVHCGGMFDPYNEITIKKGYFSIEHYGGLSMRWTHIITFKYSEIDNDWLLHKDGTTYFHSSTPEKVKTEIKTVKQFGRILFKDYNNEDEE